VHLPAPMIDERYVAGEVPDVSPELPSGRWRTTLALLARLPQGAFSRAFGAFADVPVPRPFRRTVLGGFARSVGADVLEAELPLEEYPSLNAFFTRRLRPGARAWPGDTAVAGSPVDGAVGQIGRISRGRIVQAKGRWYSAEKLLNDAAEAERYEGGAFVTLYLSPRDYHRIHAPTDAVICQAAHVPGALLPVNAAAVAHVPDLFARNERLICYLDGPLGRIAMVAVGAYNVGRISAAFDAVWNAPPGKSRWVTNRPGASFAQRHYDPPVRVRQGDELMTFHLGSTVMVLFESERLMLRASLEPGQKIRLGEPIGRAT
jgi:phosphatidylserine decarboxylase